MRLLLLGPPGSGKGTQAKLLSAEYGLMHVAPGDIFRSEIKAGTELGRLVEGILARGELVDDETTVRIIDTRLSSKEAERGFVLDGFPRTKNQAEALDRILSGRGESLDLVLAIDVAEEAILSAPAPEGVHVVRQAVQYQVSAPRIAGKCDECGGDLASRKDDKEETVRDRLDVYRSLTEPLRGYYEEQGLVAEVDGQGEIDEVFLRIKEVLREKNVVGKKRSQ